MINKKCLKCGNIPPKELSLIFRKFIAFFILIDSSLFYYFNCNKNKNFIKCPLCNGTGKGVGCWEQGGRISGLCPECEGYGKWICNKCAG